MNQPTFLSTLTFYHWLICHCQIFVNLRLSMSFKYSQIYFQKCRNRLCHILVDWRPILTFTDKAFHSAMSKGLIRIWLRSLSIRLFISSFTQFVTIVENWSGYIRQQYLAIFLVLHLAAKLIWINSELSCCIDSAMQRQFWILNVSQTLRYIKA